MNEDLSVPADPFALAVLDEQTELRALVRALQLAEGFKLIFVRCNQPQQRQQLIAALRNELPQLDVQEIHFSEPIPHLLNALRERVKEPMPGAVFVSGLEYSLPTAADAHATPFVANLNAARNSFPLVVRCPLVLWVPEYVLTAIMRGAPDFFSIRSGIYFFAAAPSDTVNLVSSFTAGEEWMVESLTLSEKQERIAAIESLLADYEALPPDQHHFQTERRLHYRLGVLFASTGSYTAAQHHFENLLTLSRQSGNVEDEQIALTSLGIVYKGQGHWVEAEALHKESLAIAQKIGDLCGQATSLNNLGNAYLSQRQLEEAEDAFQQSLMIAREVGDRNIEPTALLNLGNIYNQQDRLREAEEMYQQSLNITRQAGDRFGEAQALSNIGIVFLKEGRPKEAEDALKQSLTIVREIGNRVGEGINFFRLTLLWAMEGDLVSALDFGQQAAQILETTDDMQWLAEARSLVAALEKQIEEQKNLAETEK